MGDDPGGDGDPGGSEGNAGREPPLCVVALGGNAIKPADTEGTYEQQLRAVDRTADRVVAALREGYRVVLAHGNGPQVGAILAQQEQGSPPAQPLSVCGAMSQGQIGTMLVQRLTDRLRAAGLDRSVASVLTHAVVDPDDPAFDDPTKPVGPFVDEDRATELRAAGASVRAVREGPDRFRRVVPSPEPHGILEADSVERLVAARDLVVCGGGGGVPVSVADDADRAIGDDDADHGGDDRDDRRAVEGVDAVVDKDRLAASIAADLGADRLVILTDVDGVYRDYGGPDAERIDRTSPGRLREALAAGAFPPGSMGPKVESVCRFVERTGRPAAIAALEDLTGALAGGAGTQVRPE